MAEHDNEPPLSSSSSLDLDGVTSFDGVMSRFTSGNSSSRPNPDTTPSPTTANSDSSKFDSESLPLFLLYFASEIEYKLATPTPCQLPTPPTGIPQRPSRPRPLRCTQCQARPTSRLQFLLHQRDALTKDDVKVYSAVLEKPGSAFSSASKWYECVSTHLVASFPGQAAGVRVSCGAVQDEATTLALSKRWWINGKRL